MGAEIRLHDNDSGYTAKIKTEEVLEGPIEFILPKVGGTLVTKEEIGDLNLVSGSMSAKAIEFSMSNTYPGSGQFAPFMKTTKDVTKGGMDNVIDQYTFRLKAGRLYNIRGGIMEVTMSSGYINMGFGIYSDPAGANEIDRPINSYTYKTNGPGNHVRDNEGDFDYCPEVDCYLKLKVFNNALSAPTGLYFVGGARETILAQSTVGTPKTPDAYSTEEVLTTKRWHDNKPVYRKLFKVTATEVTKGLDVSDLDIDSVTNLEYITNTNNGSSDVTCVAAAFFDGLYGLDSNGVTYAYYHKEGQVINYKDESVSDAGVTAKESYITVEYTKNSDDENSLIANVILEDIKNVEYDTGKRRNGKIVYGIEVDCGALPNNSYSRVPIPGFNPTYTYWIDTSLSYSKRLSDGYTIPLPRPNVTSDVSVDIYSDLSAINIVTTGWNPSGFTESKVVLNYTKD